MEQIIQYLLYVHVAAGVVSLIAFWAPVFTAKGKLAHRRIGWVYICTMWVVVITAAVLSVHNLYIGRLYIGLFLGFLSLLSGNPLWQGIAVLKNKRVLTPSYKIIRDVLQVSLVLFGGFLFVYGSFYVMDGVRYLMIFFGVIGLTSVRDLYQQRKQADLPPDWYKEHYRGMIISGIAAYTAFFAFGGRQFFSDLLPGMWQILPWVLPTFIGVTAMRIMNRIRSKSASAKTQTS